VRDPHISVDIDRIVLSGLDLAPDRTEHVRELVEKGLQSRLDREGWARGLSGGEVVRLEAPGMHLAGPHSDASLADALTGNIADALRSAGSRETGRGRGGV
jgi:hypothetical protein